MNHYTLLIALLFTSCLIPVHAQNILHQYQMPPLKRVNVNDADIQTLLNRSRALRRAESSPIAFVDVIDPTAYTAALRQTLQVQLPNLPENGQLHTFAGDTASALNALLQTLAANAEQPAIVHLSSDTLQIDTPIRVPAYTWLVGRNTELQASADIAIAVLFGAESQYAGLTDIQLTAPQLGIQLDAAAHVRLQRIRFSGGRAVAVLNSRYVEITELQVDNPTQGGLLIQGDSQHIWLHHSRVTGGQRADNGGAGLLITDAQRQPTSEAMTTMEALTESIWPAAPAPHTLLIEHNTFSQHRAQGIYSDGGYANVYHDNTIADNDKEGICFDFGSANNLFMHNVVQANGWRSRQTDADLDEDLVLSFGRMADGSANAKLPGIAFDNAAQNIVLWNIIRDNAGDGIKIVRSGIRNLMLFNTLLDNNQGHNERFHFFGVLLGSAGLEPELAHVDLSDHVLDFLPPLENIVAGNVIYGSHYSGILLDREAAYNDIYDNMVRQFKHLPLESASTRFNSVVGNSWNVDNALPVPVFWGLSRIELMVLVGMTALIALLFLVALLPRRGRGGA